MRFGRQDESSYDNNTKEGFWADLNSACMFVVDTGIWRAGGNRLPYSIGVHSDPLFICLVILGTAYVPIVLFNA
jgi:hypothetical protein